MKDVDQLRASAVKYICRHRPKYNTRKKLLYRDNQVNFFYCPFTTVCIRVFVVRTQIQAGMVKGQAREI